MKNLYKKIFSIQQEKHHKIIRFCGIKLNLSTRKQYLSNNKYRFYDIKGNNKIIIVENGKEKLLNKKINGLDITINGNNNTVVLELPFNVLRNNKINISGDNNYFKLGSTQHAITNCNFAMSYFGCNRKLIIGKDFSISSGTIYMEESDSEVIIGDDCMLSYNIYIRNSDSHIILNEDKEVVNLGKKLEIGNHVWIGANSQVLKNTKIPNNSIIGTNSVVTKKFETEN